MYHHVFPEKNTSFKKNHDLHTLMRVVIFNAIDGPFNVFLRTWLETSSLYFNQQSTSIYLNSL